MSKKTMTAIGLLVGLIALGAYALAYGSRKATAAEAEMNSEPFDFEAAPATDNGFSVEVLIDDALAAEYAARGRRYIEAFENREYELRIHNPTGSRVAVALAVDGLNTIDARHTSAWDAHKWVIEPYGTISVRGWQMSSENARRFYFTSERDSYGAKIGQTANLGVIAAVFFRERKPIVITPVTPGRREEKSMNRGEDRPRKEPVPSSGESAGTLANRDAAKSLPNVYPPPDDESAATGIGRTIGNGVTW